MNWLFGRVQRPPRAQAVTGVSSDYYNERDFSSLPVAVAVPVGSDDRLTAVPTNDPTAFRPPPINPDFQKGLSIHRSEHSSGATSAPIAPLVAASSLDLQNPVSSRTSSQSIPYLQSQPAGAPTISQSQTVTSVVQPSYQPMLFERKPMRLSMCPYCSASNVRSRTETFPSWKTWLAVACIAIVFWPLAWVPLVVDCTKTTNHFCPTCHALLGSVYPFDDCCVKRRR